ncbi:MAG TPA: hypothetical protein VHE35_06480 [Kofleriaceae bacterium]|nr:hypothetical protein [Kofleriaceae bacterium]
MTNVGVAFVAIAASAAAASAAPSPSIDGLLCKRSQASDDDKQPPKLVLDVKGDQPASPSSPDGARTVSNGPNDRGGFLVTDNAKQKSRQVHNRERHYDCDMAVTEDGAANSVRWLGNDVLFAQGWYCDEFDAHPFLANGKTGKFLGALKLKGVSPEARYEVAHVSGTLWAISVYDHNSDANYVVVVDTKTGKIRATTKATDALIAKLPDCPG